jgi:hypothetical protein
MDDLPNLWAILAGVIVVIILVRRFGRGATTGKGGLGVNVEGDLLRTCRGDRGMVDRLIQHELDLKPDLSRTGAALIALSRLREDQR